MRWVLKLFKVVLTIALLTILGLSAWLAIKRPESVQLVSAYAAKTVCSNVFIAKRDANAVIRTDVQFAEYLVVKLMRTDVDVANRRVEAAFLGLFGKQRAAYADGYGCTLVSNDENLDRAIASPLPSLPTPDSFWPVGEKVQLSDNRRLQAAVNNPVLQGPGMRAIVVVHDGRIIAETYGDGFTASTPLLGWSMTKTVNAALVGLAIKDGKISLDQKNLFPQWAGDARANISVADLMAMSSGLEFNEDQGLLNDTARMELLVRDAAAFARDKPLAAAPGTKFHYGSGSSVLLARIWQNAIGAAARTYPNERLFKPLGMTSAVFEADPSGTFLGEAYLYATAHDWARFGEFMRLGGEWNGQQLLPPGFVDYMRSPVPAADEGHGPVYGRGQLWLGPGLEFDLPADTFMLNGHIRQTITIIPSRKLVILRMGMTREDIGFSNANLLHAVVAAVGR
jgi:CubicO group peptidase (beta-lactamase class C family)